MAKYDRLQHFLRRRRGSLIEMSFREVEIVIADFLPKRALRSEWWANEGDPEPRSIQSGAWLDAGYRASLVGPERVRFERIRPSGDRTTTHQ
ncbi:MAG TPA: hypothetical protein VGI79_12235 [Caulobacteraceae bacterium]